MLRNILNGNAATQIGSVMGIDLARRQFQISDKAVINRNPLCPVFAGALTAKKMSFQKEYAEPLEWIAKALKDLTFPFITSKCFYEDAYAFDADEKRLMVQGVAAFGGIAPTYRIALLDKPTIVWDFYSLLIGLQMMFSFMMAEDKTPLRMCDSCDTIL